MSTGRNKTPTTKPGAGRYHPPSRNVYWQERGYVDIASLPLEKEQPPVPSRKKK